MTLHDLGSHFGRVVLWPALTDDESVAILTVCVLRTLGVSSVCPACLREHRRAGFARYLTEADGLKRAARLPSLAVFL